MRSTLGLRDVPLALVVYSYPNARKYASGMGDWHHSPPHRFHTAGSYFVTASTLHKEHLFRTSKRLDLVRETLFNLCELHDIRPQAWAIFSNHYHFVATADEPEKLHTVLRQLHTHTAREINRWDTLEGRQVWFQFRDTLLTAPKNYYPRLRYVHNNPVKHGLVKEAIQYPWCSAGWFFRNAEAGLQRTVNSFGIERLSVYDE